MGNDVNQMAILKHLDSVSRLDCILFPDRCGYNNLAFVKYFYGFHDPPQTAIKLNGFLLSYNRLKTNTSQNPPIITCNRKFGSLFPKDKIETGINLFEKIAGEDADAICQKMFVDGDNLRDICYRIVGKTGASLRQHDISRRLSQTEIPGYDYKDDR